MSPRLLLAAVVLLVPATGVAQTPRPTAYQQYVVQQQVPPPAPALAGGQPMLAAAAGSQAEPADDGVEWDSLRDQAMGFVKGCDYGKYLEIASALQSAWALYEGWQTFMNLRNMAVPFMDMVSMFLRGGTVVAARKSAEYEARGLMYQLEQLCNAVKQADEINRSYKIVRAGKLNIEGALDWLGEALGSGMLHSREAGADREQASEHWALDFDKAVFYTGSRKDSLWTSISSTLGETLSASNDLQGALDEVSENLADIKRSLVLTADHDADTDTWTCPEGYPDPGSNPAGESMDGAPVCGPVGPERATQLLAHIELIKAHLKAIQMATDARGLEVDAVRLMADNYQRRLTSTARIMTTIAQ